MEILNKLILAISIMLFYSESTSLTANQKCSSDISFLIADLKYTVQNEIKICEIQQGTLSTFKGDRFTCKNIGNIAPFLLEFLSQYQKPVWTHLGYVADYGIKKSIKEFNWLIFNDLSKLCKDPLFCSYATKSPKDPKKIKDYHGFIFSGLSLFTDLDSFRKKFPGILILDTATKKYWIDKYKMSLVFKNNPKLSKYKPKWNAYPKVYSKELANQIANDLECDRFVIKPRKGFCGKGVIIVDKVDLDAVLFNILNKNLLIRVTDPGQKYWRSDRSDSFIVEEFISSEPIRVPHLDDKLYEPTIRVAFFLIFDNETIQVEICGAYYRLPCKSIDEIGTLNELYKDYADVPYFEKIEPEIYEQIKEELLIMLPIFYEEILKN